MYYKFWGFIIISDLLYILCLCESSVLKGELFNLTCRMDSFSVGIHFTCSFGKEPIENIWKGRPFQRWTWKVIWWTYCLLYLKQPNHISLLLVESVGNSARLSAGARVDTWLALPLCGEPWCTTLINQPLAKASSKWRRAFSPVLCSSFHKQMSSSDKTATTVSTLRPQFFTHSLWFSVYGTGKPWHHSTIVWTVITIQSELIARWVCKISHSKSWQSNCLLKLGAPDSNNM